MCNLSRKIIPPRSPGRSLAIRSIRAISTSRPLRMADFPPAPLKKIAEEVAKILTERQETISVAETAAGGLISASLLATPGASKFYKGGLTLYTLQSRVEFAGWKQSDIDSYRGPSKEIVTGLAENVREKLGSTYCVCEEAILRIELRMSNPVLHARVVSINKFSGYVALAVAHDGGHTTSTELDTGYGPDRQSNMLAFALHALKLVKDVASTRSAKV